jgi:uncharacterized membrane protein (UPF0127 family)
MFLISSCCGAGKTARFLAVMASLALGIISACAQPSKLPIVQGRFVTDSGAETPSFRLEVCSNDGERAMGLMYRRSLDEKAGMLFVFPEERHNSFWMRNTYIPLDMVFVGKDMKVVGVLHNVPPLNELPRSVDAPSMYVVEFASGTMKRYGVEAGAVFKMSAPLPRAQ